MSDELDRAVQRQLLLEMRDKFPHKTLKFKCIEASLQLYRNLQYLEGHDLCIANLHYMDQGPIGFSGAKITSKGIDFLSDDGGLSAILGVVNVKIHADTLRELLAARVAAADIPADEKSKLRQVIGSLPEVSLRAVATDLVQRGIGNIPNFVEWLYSSV